MLVSEKVAWEDPTSRALNSQMQEATGIGTVRFTFDWNKIETAPGQYDFFRYDMVVQDAALHGMQVLPTLVGAPAWRNSSPPDPDRGLYPPARPEEMGQFAQVLVARYGPDGSFWAERGDVPYRPIRSWQVWNEPNVPAWWASGADPAAYTALLRAVGSAIKAADPGAEIVTAGIPNSGGWTIGSWVQAMYAAGARGTFDTLASHPYGADSEEVMAHVREARAVLDAHGDPRPIWVTEFGWATAGEPSRYTVTEDGQALRIRTTLRALAEQRQALGLRGFIYFHWRDSANGTLPGPGLWSAFTGLLAGNGRSKPGYTAFAKAVREHWGAPGPPPPDNPAGFGGPTGPAVDQPEQAADEGWRGDSPGRRDDPAPPAAGAFAGVTADDVFGDAPNVRDNELEHARAAGVEVIRHPFRWKAIERRRGAYDLRRLDAVVLTAADKGLGVLPAITAPPRFRRGREAAGVRALMAALARRYGPGGSLWAEHPDSLKRPIVTWQVDPPSRDPRAYAKLLTRAHSGLAGVDPGAELVAAAPDPRFLRALYDVPGRPAWDSAGVSAFAPSTKAVVGSLRSARRVMNAEGDPGGGLWLTGTGWATSGRRGPLKVGTAGQAARISKLFADLGRGRRSLGLRGVVYQGWRDGPDTGPGPGGEMTGLVDSTGRPKRGLRAFAQAAATAAQQRS